ncbi:MAG: hypothetical protein AAFV90_21470 [Cyanobacteria bacterium J06634_5]
MKRLILSAFSVLLATAAVAPTAQALPKVDPAFDIQTLRLSEFDSRNKSEEYPQPYSPQTSTQPSAPTVSAEPDSAQTTKPTVWETSWETPWETPENLEEAGAPALSLTQRRQQALDRS